MATVVEQAAGAPRRRASDEFGPRALVVLGIATLTATLTGPGQTIGVSVFIDHFVSDLGLSRSQVGLAYLIGTMTGALLLPTVGSFVDRRGVRFAQIVVGALFALALVNMSFVEGFVWLAVGFTGIRFLGQGSLSLVANVTVALQFARRRGTAIGIFSTVSGALMASVPVLLAFVIAGVGWRSAWLVAAAVVAATVIPMAIFGLRSMPAGGPAVERPDATTEPASPAPKTAGSYSRGEAMRTRPFWMLASVTASAGMLGTALNFHQIDFMGDVGIDEKAAAALFIPQILGSSVAGLGIGYSSDRIGTRFLPAVGMALLVGSYWLASVISPGAIVFVYAVMLGAMGGAVRTAASTLLPKWFGTGNLGSIQGSLTFFNVGASAIGPVALSVTEEGLGSYPPAVLALSVIPLLALLFSLLPIGDLRAVDD